MISDRIVSQVEKSVSVAFLGPRELGDVLRLELHPLPDLRHLVAFDQQAG